MFVLQQANDTQGDRRRFVHPMTADRAAVDGKQLLQLDNA